jgi:hypothetical protein
MASGARWGWWVAAGITFLVVGATASSVSMAVESELPACRYNHGENQKREEDQQCDDDTDHQKQEHCALPDRRVTKVAPLCRSRGSPSSAWRASVSGNTRVSRAAAVAIAAKVAVCGIVDLGRFDVARFLSDQPR